MTAYIIRRALYAIPILLGVNILTFVLFFVVNSPDDMARMHLGMKRVTPEAIEKWKAQRGYDLPLLYNAAAGGSETLTETIFFQKSARLFAFDFGSSDAGRNIGADIKQRMWRSLAIALPQFLLGLLVYALGSLGLLLIGLALAYHAMGDQDGSDTALAELIEKHAQEWAYNIAYVHAARAQRDLAFEWLERAVEYHDPGLALAVFEPNFANLENDPRWLEFLHRLGKAPEQLEAIDFSITPRY